MQETIGIYKARPLKTNDGKTTEMVFHAPDSVSGKYYLIFNPENGVVKYVPVHMVEVTLG